MTKSRKKLEKKGDLESRVSIYPAWCKRCGYCVEFCPTRALELDEWGYPRMVDPEKCTSCHLCEKLCPDFAISVGEKPPRAYGQKSAEHRGAPRGDEGLHSPERLAPHAIVDEEKDEDAD